MPRIDLDRPKEHILQPCSREEIYEALRGLAARPLANIVKSHYAADFFAGNVERLTERYVIFVVYRNPVAVMQSFWRYLHRFTAADNAGPQVADPLTFARAQPFGLMLRYQTRSYATVLERWTGHIQGWRQAAATCSRIVFVRYENLDARYEETVRSFGQVLGQPPVALGRPARAFNVIPAGPPDPMNTGIPPDVAALERLCRQTVGATMATLGY